MALRVSAGARLAADGDAADEACPVLHGGSGNSPGARLAAADGVAAGVELRTGPGNFIGVRLAADGVVAEVELRIGAGNFIGVRFAAEGATTHDGGGLLRTNSGNSPGLRFAAGVATICDGGGVFNSPGVGSAHTATRSRKKKANKLLWCMMVWMTAFEWGVRMGPESCWRMHWRDCGFYSRFC